MARSMTTLATVFELAKQHRKLLKDLLLILMSCLVCFLYFSEQWHHQSRTQRQQGLEALAVQLAETSYVPLAADNLVSLNVLTGQLVALPPVGGARVEYLDRRLASSAGDKATMKAVAAVGGQQKDIIGRVVVYGKPVAGLSFWPFWILLLCLLGIRVAVALFWEQLVPFSSRAIKGIKKYSQATRRVTRSAPVPTLPVEPAASAQLDIQVCDYARLSQWFTPTALQQTLAAYDALLRRVAGIYGVTLDSPLGATTKLELGHDSAEEAVFLLSCCANLFMAACDTLNAQRRESGDTCLAFSLLLSQQAPDELRESLNQQEVEQQLRLLVAAPSDHLKARLNAHHLEQWQGEDDVWQLLTDATLAERYRKLVASQLDSLALAPLWVGVPSK